MKIPHDIENKTFMATKAGGFSGVPLRTLQVWSKFAVVVPDIEDASGKGAKRIYSIYNCIEIALVKELSSWGVYLDDIRAIIQDIRKGTPLTLREAIREHQAYIVIRKYDHGKVGAGCFSTEKYGPRSHIETGVRSFLEFWYDATSPKDSQHVVSYIVRLSQLAERILKRIQTDS